VAIVDGDQAVTREEHEPATGVRIWDLPLRLFHWSLAIAVSISLYTGLTGGFEEMIWHQRSGFVILGLLGFRLLWGLVGTRHARFATFVRGPGVVLEWIRGTLAQRQAPWSGHNPLAGWSIVALLAALLVQSVSGLFASDDLLTEGPLTHLVSNEGVSRATAIHAWGQWTVGGLVGLHLLALLIHRFVLGERITAAMITGRRRDLAASEGIDGHRLPLALVLAAVTVIAVWWVVTRL
jgi:cytochrome b